MNTLTNSWLVRGAIASVVLGGAVYILWVQTKKHRKPKSLVAELSNSNTKTAKDMVDQLLSMFFKIKLFLSNILKTLFPYFTILEHNSISIKYVH